MDALLSTPTSVPGTAYCYSNWAYVVAGHILERTTGRLWEDLIVEKLFRPLGMTSLQRNTTFGIPRGLQDARGHSGVSPLIPCDCDNPAVLGPAGTFSGPTAAMALYLSWHVACHNGNHNNRLLSQEACRKLHTPVSS
jgi:CubicO group peptidase (beta-lactamase class C family)